MVPVDIEILEVWVAFWTVRKFVSVVFSLSSYNLQHTWLICILKVPILIIFKPLINFKKLVMFLIEPKNLGPNLEEAKLLEADNIEHW